jgi:hypothetical protein
MELSSSWILLASESCLNWADCITVDEFVKSAVIKRNNLFGNGKVPDLEPKNGRTSIIPKAHCPQQR